MDVQVAESTLRSMKPSFHLPRVGRKITRGNVIPVALGLAFLFGAGDFFTGIELAFTLLYLLPIALATWFRGRAFGIVVALLCTTIAVVTEVYARLHRGWHIHPFTMAWNHGGTVGLYGIGIVLLCRLRVYVEREAQERRLAVEQLRHAERLNLIGKLAAGVAHELGTPLNVILGSAEVLEGDEASSEKARRIATTIQNQATKMTAIIRQLLDFSRKGATETTVVDLARLAKEEVLLLQSLAKKHRTEIVVVETSETPIIVRANRVELGQVLNNLVMNAIQAMPHGGTVRVHCDARRGRGPENTNTFVAALTVSDEGTGIRAEDLVRIFDPFFTTKDVGAGTGLGLSVTYGIVHDHGGTIQVDSRLGTGSQFTVLLPLSP
jgi:signal transduction histidine kinase